MALSGFSEKVGRSARCCLSAFGEETDFLFTVFVLSLKKKKVGYFALRCSVLNEKMKHFALCKIALSVFADTLLLCPPESEAFGSLSLCLSSVRKRYVLLSIAFSLDRM